MFIHHTVRFPMKRAQGLVEYGLIIALVALLAIGGLVLLGPLLSSMFSSMTGSV
jgi:Flp pilus assembly pilin Flp